MFSFNSVLLMNFVIPVNNNEITISNLFLNWENDSKPNSLTLVLHTPFRIYESFLFSHFDRSRIRKKYLGKIPCLFGFVYVEGHPVDANNRAKLTCQKLKEIICRGETISFQRLHCDLFTRDTRKSKCENCRQNTTAKTNDGDNIEEMPMECVKSERNKGKNTL